MNRYRKFIVNKFGRENDSIIDGSDLSDGNVDDKWSRADKFTNLFPRKQSAKKLLDAEALSRSASKSKKQARGGSNSKKKRMLTVRIEAEASVERPR